MTAAGQALRETGRSLAEAPDEQVLKVVGMIDGLDERGGVDAVLSPIRKRLRKLRAPRRVRFERLLFTPVDALILPPATWCPGGVHLSRGFIAPIAQLVRQGADPAILAAVDRAIARASGDCARQAGLLLWPEAARVLRSACRRLADASWRAAGLPDDEFVPAAGGLAEILAAEQELASWDGGVWQAAQEHGLAAFLQGAGRRGHRAWGMMLALLLIRFPQSQATFDAAQDVAASDRAAQAMVHAAFGAAFSAMENAQAPAVAIAPDAAATVARLAALIGSLAVHLPDQESRARARQHMVRLSTACLSQFTDSLRSDLAEPLRQQAGHISDAMQDRAEETARKLRQFEQAARRLGDGVRYDALLEDTAAGLDGLSALECVDRARLLEILQGTQVAWATLPGHKTRALPA